MTRYGVWYTELGFFVNPFYGKKSNFGAYIDNISGKFSTNDINVAHRYLEEMYKYFGEKPVVEIREIQ